MEAKMATATAPDVAALESEIRQLRAGLEAATEKMRGLRNGEASNGQASTFGAAERMWSEVKQQAQQVGHEIEERPLVSALTAFGAGIALGVLLGARRG
jgi:ElaB/YqjD/DUF883 family membrane-anchored ribosome-binding protein